MAWPFPRKDDSKGVVRSVSNQLMGWFNWGNSTSGETVTTPDDALTISAVYAAVKILAEDISRMPINLYKIEDANGFQKRTLVRDHPYYKLLSKKPNAWQTRSEFIASIVAQAALGRGALCLLTKVGNEVREIIPVPLGRWTQELLADGTIQYRVDFLNGTQGVFDSSQCLFIHHALTLDCYSAVPVVEKARRNLSLAASLEKHQLQFTTGANRPSGILSFENPLTDKQLDELQEDWAAKFGPGGRGGVAILEGAAKFESVTMSMVDSQFLESREQVIYDIARYFGVSPEKLYAKGTKTYASAREATKAHIDRLIPWLIAIEEALNRDILGNDPNLEFDIDEKDLLRGNNAEQADYVTKLLGAGGAQAVISINEARFELGLPALDGEEYDKPSKGGYAQAAGLSNQPPQEQNPDAT